MRISVECNTDKYFLDSLLKYGERQDILVLHQRGKSGVLEWLKKNPDGIGMIDEDPEAIQHPYEKDFEKVDNCLNFKLYEEKGEGHRKLIIVSPILEIALLDISRSNGIDMNEYGMVSEVGILHGINPYRNLDYQRFLDKLIETSSELSKVRDWLV